MIQAEATESAFISRPVPEGLPGLDEGLYVTFETEDHVVAYFACECRGRVRVVADWEPINDPRWHEMTMGWVMSTTPSCDTCHRDRPASERERIYALLEGRE